MKLTPAMKQYMEIKEQHPDCVVMFRMGDFYEMFYEDAKISARVLGITLTARGKGESKAPLAGIPYHALEQYVKKFVKAGYRVAMVEQLEDPKKAKGVVKRGVVRIITPGTVIEDSILSKESNNYICAINEDKGYYGISFCDISTGEFLTSVCDTEVKLFSELERFHPSEILLPLSLIESNLNTEIKRRGFVVTPHDDRYFWNEKATKTINDHFETKVVDGFGIKDKPLCISTSGSLLAYLHKTQMNSLKNISRLHSYSIEEYMILDSPTQRNLELLKNIRDNTTRGTVFDVINKTKTSMGSRKLKSWILRPLGDKGRIDKRLNAIDELKDEALLREELKDILADVSDIERIISRVTYGSANARDMVSLRSSLTQLPDLKSLIQKCNSEFLCQLKDLNELSNLRQLIENAITDEPPITLREGKLIRQGYNKDLDELREISTNGKQWLLDFENQEKEKTGIKNLRVKYNKVFGYFIEITKANLGNVPEHYIRKQTQVNSERFITEELKEKEAILLGAQDKIHALEYDLFMKVIEVVASHTLEIQDIASKIASLDCILSLAQVAVENNYCKPTITTDNQIHIEDGRHPVVEKIESGSFVSNSTLIGEQNKVHIITGPNMAGKSTYLRQVALIALLAQVGSFVPASSATIGLVDRIFSRVGAYDDLSMGQSTFMVEMSETANILNSATGRSLIIMDEVGRGTSTYDGLSLAWAIVEYILESISAKTLFATHYHHMNRMVTQYEGIENYNILVEESDGDVAFLHKIVHGGTDKSYGIHVAKLAGVPKQVIDRSKVIMNRIENQEQLASNITRLDESSAAPEQPSQIPAQSQSAQLGAQAATPAEANTSQPKQETKEDKSEEKEKQVTLGSF